MKQFLLGETSPKNKGEERLKTNTELAERRNIGFEGTIVTKGRGKGVVYAIGKDTEFGKVAENVLMSDETKSPLTIKIEKFSKQISIVFFIFSVILALILYIKNYAISEIFSAVIALTISAIPEGLTIAMTIVLSRASTKMAKKNVIIKKLNSVESLGSCTVIATDKTGTLTANEQTAKKVIFPNDKTAYIRGIGYNDIGEIESEDNILNEIKEISLMGVINNEATLKYEDNKWIHTGDSIDTAFLAMGLKASVSDNFDIKYRIAYEPVLKYSAVFFYEDDKITLTVKGATEKVLEFCEYMDINGFDEKIDKEKIIKQNEMLASEGYRVIAVAKQRVNKLKPKDEYNENDMKKLTFLGLVGFIDPIRDGVKEATYMCKKAGIKTIMITGDQKNTAEAIGKKLDITKIFSRVTPMEKLEIINNLKVDNEFVAVTGDGVNDVPALKAANIGIAMGSGTDIAKDTGNMIITDDNFSSIVNGVKEGRHAYNNIRKVIYLLLSTGLSEVILFVLAIIFNFPIPLIAIQLLWLNLITNGVQGDALAFENDKEDVLNKKVKKQTIFDKLMIEEIVISGIVMSAIEFSLYVYLYKVLKCDITIVRTYLLTLMIFMENVQIFNCRSEKISAFEIPISNNKLLIISIFITMLFQIIIVNTGFLTNVFGIGLISLSNILKLIVLTTPLIIIMELYKALIKRKNVNIV